MDDANVWGRPVGITVASDGSLVFTDDASNSIWRVTYVGNKTRCRKVASFVGRAACRQTGLRRYRRAALVFSSRGFIPLKSELHFPATC